MRRTARSTLLVALALALAGCFAGPKRNPPLPADWGKPVVARIGECPAIAGVYRGKGQLALESGVECLGTKMNTSNPSGEWNCSEVLTDNLGLSEPFAPTVELRQPDGDTLEIVRRDEKGEASGVRTLKRGKEFSCDTDTLSFSGTASAMPGGMAVLGAVMLSGGVLNHTRSFARDTEGGLVMTVRSRQLLFAYGIPMGTSETSHVRWLPASPKEGAAK